MRINAFHRAVLKHYADGDGAHLIEQEQISRVEIDDFGDSPQALMLIELSGKEGCDKVETGIARLTHGRDDFDFALAALEALQAATGATAREEEALGGPAEKPPRRSPTGSA